MDHLPPPGRPGVERAVTVVRVHHSLATGSKANSLPSRPLMTQAICVISGGSIPAKAWSPQALGPHGAPFHSGAERGEAQPGAHTGPQLPCNNEPRPGGAWKPPGGRKTEWKTIKHSFCENKDVTKSQASGRFQTFLNAFQTSFLYGFIARNQTLLGTSNRESRRVRGH